ncbi:MAG: glycine cleavage system protein R [Candidatus Goldiibacteriota bacterium]
MERLLIVAGGVDRKGVVYKITKILKKYNFNIEDSSMILLRRTFSMIMMVSHDGKYSKKDFREDIRDFRRKNDMGVDIRKITEKDCIEYNEEGGIYLLSISGADKPGIVNEITKILYKNDVNIIDLETKSSEKVKPHAYYMFMEVDVPGKTGIKKLEKELKLAARKIGVKVNINMVDTDIL